MLNINNLKVMYGTETAVNGVSLDVDGEVVCLCGRNGAGKSTILKSVAGIVNLNAGEVLLDDEEISSVPLRNRLKIGIGYVPEDRKLFEEMTVRENIKIAQIGANVPIEEQINIDDILPELETFYDRKSKQLSGGQQKMVSIARAIVTSPKVLLFDELLEGLARSLTIRISDVITEIKKEGKDILCAESSLDKAKLYADRVVWLERGEILAEGTPEEIKTKMEKIIRN